MNKLIVFLVDGLDPYILERFKDSLPNINRLISDGTFKVLKSVIPPDSIPAWATIYTGCNPGVHGIFESIDYLKVKSNNISMDNSVFIGNTFWDKISADGFKVGVFNPFIAYPSWDVNGFMISGPVFESGNISTNEARILEKYTIPPLGGIVDYPDPKSYHSFLERSLQLLQDQNSVAINLIKNEKPSFFFYGNLIVDRIKHFYWKFMEQNDNELGNAILKVYQEIDNFISNIMNAISDQYDLLIISDHGHQKRVTKTFNLNEWLRKEGYIQKKLGYKFFIEKIKNLSMSFFDSINQIDFLFKLSRFIPNIKKIKNSEYINDSSADIYVPKYAGMNPFGGICFNKEKVKPETINEIMEKLLNVYDKKTGKKIVKWVKRREEIYQGTSSHKFPDIIFELDDDYGICLNFYTNNIIGKNYNYTRISGGHRRDGVFLLSKKISKQGDISIEEIHNIILDLFYGRI